MATQKIILKNTRRQAAVKVTGTGQATIDIYELAYPDQTITTANLQLTITDIYYDVSTTSNIIRNSNVVWAMNSAGDLRFAQEIGVSLNHDANANVVVNLGGTVNSAVVIQFSKGEGYNDPNRQNQGPGSL